MTFYVKRLTVLELNEHPSYVQFGTLVVSQESSILIS